MALPTPYKHHDGRNLHLGKGPAKQDARRFMLSSFLPMATPPVSVNWFGSVTEYGEMLNNDLGDCTCAAVGHAEQVASLNTPEGELTFPDNIVLNLYEKSCGYVFNDPSTDNGGVITDVLAEIEGVVGRGTHATFARGEKGVDAQRPKGRYRQNREAVTTLLVQCDLNHWQFLRCQSRRPPL